MEIKACKTNGSKITMSCIINHEIDVFPEDIVEFTFGSGTAAVSSFFRIKEFDFITQEFLCIEMTDKIGGNKSLLGKIDFNVLSGRTVTDSQEIRKIEKQSRLI